jgi:hypothetical protein
MFISNYNNPIKSTNHEDQFIINQPNIEMWN